MFGQQGSCHDEWHKVTASDAASTMKGMLSTATMVDGLTAATLNNITMTRSIFAKRFLSLLRVFACLVRPIPKRLEKIEKFKIVASHVRYAWNNYGECHCKFSLKIERNQKRCCMAQVHVLDPTNVRPRNTNGTSYLSLNVWQVGCTKGRWQCFCYCYSNKQNPQVYKW